MFRIYICLSVADQFIKTGMYKNILVIGSENHSGGLEKSTRGRGVTVIFGDGAGAAVVSRSKEKKKEFYHLIYILRENMLEN